MKVGDTVRLKAAKTTNRTAAILRINRAGAVLLNERLAGFQWWNVEDLRVVTPPTTDAKP